MRIDKAWQDCAPSEIEHFGVWCSQRAELFRRPNRENSAVHDSERVDNGALIIQGVDAGIENQQVSLHESSTELEVMAVVDKAV